MEGQYHNKNGSFGLFAGSFPAKQAEEWERDCKDNFNGCRWLKMWSDHLLAKVATKEIELGEAQQKSEVEETDEVPTIGRKVEEHE